MGSPSGGTTPEAAHKVVADGRRMAFTAIHPEHGRLDATRSDLGCGLDWSQVYRVRPRVSLTCPECGWGVHAKRSPRRARYFAHNPGRPPDCQLSNESVEHHLLKLELATVVRASGWHAELEVRAPDGSWRADVMASAPDGGRRMAWEAQLSPITLDDLRERTGRYTDAGIGVCWVSPRDDGVPWLGAVPAVRVTPPPQGATEWTVADGIAQFDEGRGAWIRVKGTELGVFARWVLNDQIAPHSILARYRRIYLTPGGAMARRGMIWTTARSTAAEARHEKEAPAARSVEAGTAAAGRGSRRTQATGGGSPAAGRRTPSQDRTGSRSGSGTRAAQAVDDRTGSRAQAPRS
ncbi:hypothetical protein GCM10020295_36550 [Streptomyces cinereospinus]